MKLFTQINIFNNNSSSHADNCRNNFLMLDEGPTNDINGSFGTAEKKFSINFSITKTTFCLSLHYDGDSRYLFNNGKKSVSLKLIIKM